MKLTTEKLKKMIQEEIKAVTEMYDQSMGATLAGLKDRELYSYINMIKRDYPGISDEEALEMAEEQMEADQMGMEPYEYAASEERGESMPVRESRKKRKKNG
jgi:hypothetical protein